jgi:hypothetical protein
MNTTFRGVMKGQTLVVLDQAVPFPDGTPVQVTALGLEAGDPTAVLAAMEAEPRVTQEDVADLERAIAEGQRPPAMLDPFAEERQ